MMKQERRWVFVGAILVAAALAGCAEPPVAESTDQSSAGARSSVAGGHAILTPEDIEWQEAPPSLPPGARLAVLSGDLAAEEGFTMRAEFPAGYLVPAHTHPSAEHVTILSGTAYLTMGAAAAQSNATELPEGSFIAMPPGTIHEFRAGEEPVVLQVHGTGPWGINYVDPADDPRNE